MKKKLLALILGLTTIVSLVGCTSNSNSTETKETTKIEAKEDKKVEKVTGKESKEDFNPEREDTSKTEDSTEELEVTDNRELTNNDITTGINTLGFQLHDKIQEYSDKTKNTLQSPYSIALAFSMLDLTADKETKEQLESVLGIKNLDLWNNQVKILLDKEKELDKLKVPDEYGDTIPKLLTANSIWVSDSMSLSENAEKEVLNTIEDSYNGEVFTVNFKDSTTGKQIDNWIDTNTKGLIKSLGADTSDLESLLINTIYFKGTWVNQFDTSRTEKKEFRNESEVTEVDSMRISESFRYLEDDSLEAISLPYYGDFEMLIIKSTDNEDLTTEKFDSLSTEEKQNFLNKFSDSADYIEFKTVQIPKFKYEYEYEYSNIKKDLIQLGITDAFSPEAANLSKLADGLYVNDVKHKAVISVDEDGTEAAAMTALMIDAAMAIGEYNPPTKEFIADKPFTYIIRNSETGLIYFIGTINSLE